MFRGWIRAALIGLCIGFSATTTASFELVSRVDGNPLLASVPNGQVISPSISSNGRFVAFASNASNLVAGDPNGQGSNNIIYDIFVYDRDTNSIELLTPGGNRHSLQPSISADGRFVVFDSRATNLVSGDSSDQVVDVFLYDRNTDTTQKITAGGNDDSRSPTISGDGRFIAFESRAGNLVAGDTNGSFDIFVFDTLTDTTELLAPGGGLSDNSVPQSISADGRFVAFVSSADDLAVGDTNGSQFDIFVFDRDTDTIELVSAGGNSDSFRPAISADGRVVVFDSRASNLATADTNGGNDDVFAYDRDTGVLSLLSAGGNNASFRPTVSADGRVVVFQSSADNLVAGGDSRGIFSHNLGTGVTEILSTRPFSTVFVRSVEGFLVRSPSLIPSISADGELAVYPSIDTNALATAFISNRSMNSEARVIAAELPFEAVGGNLPSTNPSVSSTGRFVAFESSANNLVAGDTTRRDIFVRDRETQRTENLTFGANGRSENPSISADGRFVVFESEARNIEGAIPFFVSEVFPPTNIFVYDRDTDTTELLTPGTTRDSRFPSISADGRFVAFSSLADNLVPGDTNGTRVDIFVYDRQTSTTEILTAGANSDTSFVFNTLAAGPSISADGQFVAFQSGASNLVAGDTNGSGIDIFLYDRNADSIERLTTGGNGASRRASISNDGRFVAFESTASNLVANDVDGSDTDVFVYDRQSDTTQLLNAGVNTTGLVPSISGDGGMIAFIANSTLVVFDREANSFESPTEDAGFSGISVAVPSISADGQVVAFSSEATNLTSDGVFVDTDSVFVSVDNVAPTADSLSAATNEDTAISLILTGFDSDGDALTFQTVTQPGNGVLSGTAPNFVYTPNADFFGPDSFSFTSNDGGLTSEPATVTIDVIGVNDAPVAEGTDAGTTNLSTPEDTALAVTLLGSDVEGDALTYLITTLPSNGSLSGTAPNLTYLPATDFNGTDSFSFTVSDGALTSAPVTISLTVSSTNDAPIANSLSLATTPNTSVSAVLSGTDPDSASLSFALFSLPANGTLSGDLPNVIYTPDSDFTGEDSFTFTVGDGITNSAPATVSITVSGVIPPPPVNNAPVANAQAVSLPQDTSVSILLTGSDADGDALSFDFVAQPANGSLTGTPPNLVYTPDANYIGPDSFAFTVSDAEATSGVATVSISVVEANVTIFSAVLPASRSVEVGATATAFATLINAGSTNALGCVVGLPDDVPASFFYQASDPNTNEVIGLPNAPVDIPAGVAQSFVFGITPTEAFSARAVALEFQCANSAEAASFVGLNTLRLSASLAPVPDLIALVATLSNNGVMELAGNSGFFTSASINVGSAATITVSADTGSATLPLTLSLCQTDPVTSACINPTVPSTEPVIVEVAEGGTPTFAVFATASDSIVLDPANSRVFLFFNDELGEVRGSTSVAVENRQ